MPDHLCNIWYRNDEFRYIKAILRQYICISLVCLIGYRLGKNNNYRWLVMLAFICMAPLSCYEKNERENINENMVPAGFEPTPYVYIFQQYNFKTTDIFTQPVLRVWTPESVSVLYEVPIKVRPSIKPPLKHLLYIRYFKAYSYMYLILDIMHSNACDVFI